MKKRIRFFQSAFLLFLFLFCFSCVHKTEDSLLTQLRIRGMQSRAFVGYNAKTVTKEIISVLQDEGYMLKSVNGDLGVLTAERNTNIEKFSSKFFAYLFSGKRARWNKQSILEITTNVIEEKEKIRVRVNFLLRIIDNLGRVVDVHQIFDPATYVDFFNKIQNGLLSQKVPDRVE